MDRKITRLLNDAEKKLLALFREGLFEIILFGSYARGDYDGESDIDLIALINEDDLKKYDKQILNINVDLSLKYEVDLSIVIESKNHFDSNVDIIPLFKNINRDGVNIYAAA